MERASHHRIKKLGAANVAVGLWTLVAAVAIGVTWQTPDKPAMATLVRTSQIALAFALVDLALTAAFHLHLGRALRQESAPISGPTIGLFLLGHTTLLLVILKVSLRNPKSPVFLGGAEELIGAVLSTAVVSAVVLLLTMWRLRKLSGELPATLPAKRTSLALSVAYMAGAATLTGLLLNLDGQPWPS